MYFTISGDWFRPRDTIHKKKQQIKQQIIVFIQFFHLEPKDQTQNCNSCKWLAIPSQRAPRQSLSSNRSVAYQFQLNQIVNSLNLDPFLVMIKIPIGLYCKIDIMVKQLISQFAVLQLLQKTYIQIFETKTFINLLLIDRREKLDSCFEPDT